ncbi:MAG: hypothetical protein HC846_12510, partial [Blastocatellia bacterium]|nr:hypothetical protein [Blastocatellia bacterium]
MSVRHLRRRKIRCRKRRVALVILASPYAILLVAFGDENREPCNEHTAGIFQIRFGSFSGGGFAAWRSGERIRKRCGKFKIAEAARKPVLRTEFFKSPVKIESVELLKNGKHFVTRVRST